MYTPLIGDLMTSGSVADYSGTGRNSQYTGHQYTTNPGSSESGVVPGWNISKRYIYFEGIEQTL